MPLSASTATHGVFLQIDLECRSDPADQMIECSFFGTSALASILRPRSTTDPYIQSVAFAQKINTQVPNMAPFCSIWNCLPAYMQRLILHVSLLLNIPSSSTTAGLTCRFLLRLHVIILIFYSLFFKWSHVFLHLLHFAQFKHRFTDNVWMKRLL